MFLPVPVYVLQAISPGSVQTEFQIKAYGAETAHKMHTSVKVSENCLDWDL